MRDLMTITEVCEYLHFSRGYVSKLTQSNDLPCIRIGRRVLVDRAQLEKWLDDHSSENY